MRPKPGVVQRTCNRGYKNEATMDAPCQQSGKTMQRSNPNGNAILVMPVIQEIAEMPVIQEIAEVPQSQRCSKALYHTITVKRLAG